MIRLCRYNQTTILWAKSIFAPYILGQGVNTDVLSTTLLEAYQDYYARKQGGNGRLYLACSGGRDSLSLAYACWLLYQQGRIDKLPILLHVHHGWQTANDDWAKMLSSWAVQYGFECHILPVKLSKNSETHARDARYQAMMSMMACDDVLMLAHHANDQAETVLMRLADGAGLQGLSGIKTWQKKSLMIENSAKTIMLWRPWLTATRECISRFAHQHELPYVDDATNLDDRYMRGHLRQHILPQLAIMNPKAITNISRSAALLGGYLAVIDDWLAEKIPLCVDVDNLPYQQVLFLPKLYQFDEAVQQLLIHHWLQADEPVAPPQAISVQVHRLAYRHDNDHNSQIWWQGRQAAYVICRYDNCLYRYRQDVWQLLQHSMIQPQRNQDGWVLLDDGNCQLQLHCPPSQITTVQQQKITIGQYQYRGKKLAQKLRIPTWLRRHLWQLSIDDNQYLIAPMMAWRLPSGDGLDNFAPIGRMVYNDKPNRTL